MRMNKMMRVIVKVIIIKKRKIKVMNMTKIMLKIIVNKVIIKVHKYNSNDGIGVIVKMKVKMKVKMMVLNIICIEYYMYWCDSEASEYNPRPC